MCASYSMKDPHSPTERLFLVGFQTNKKSVRRTEEPVKNKYPSLEVDFHPPLDVDTPMCAKLYFRKEENEESGEVRVSPVEQACSIGVKILSPSPPEKGEDIVEARTEKCLFNIVVDLEEKSKKQNQNLYCLSIAVGQYLIWTTEFRLGSNMSQKLKKSKTETTKPIRSLFSNLEQRVVSLETHASTPTTLISNELYNQILSQAVATVEFRGKVRKLYKKSHLVFANTSKGRDFFINLLLDIGIKVSVKTSICECTHFFVTHDECHPTFLAHAIKSQIRIIDSDKLDQSMYFSQLLDLSPYTIDPKLHLEKKAFYIPMDTKDRNRYVDAVQIAGGIVCDSKSGCCGIINSWRSLGKIAFGYSDRDRVGVASGGIGKNPSGKSLSSLFE